MTIGDKLFWVNRVGPQSTTLVTYTTYLAMAPALALGDYYFVHCSGCISNNAGSALQARLIATDPLATPLLIAESTKLASADPRQLGILRATFQLFGWVSPTADGVTQIRLEFRRQDGSVVQMESATIVGYIADPFTDGVQAATHPGELTTNLGTWTNAMSIVTPNLSDQRVRLITRFDYRNQDGPADLEYRVTRNGAPFITSPPLNCGGRGIGLDKHGMCDSSFRSCQRISGVNTFNLDIRLAAGSNRVSLAQGAMFFFPLG